MNINNSNTVILREQSDRENPKNQKHVILERSEESRYRSGEVSLCKRERQRDFVQVSLFRKEGLREFLKFSLSASGEGVRGKGRLVFMIKNLILRQMLSSLLDERLKPYRLAGVFSPLHHHVQHGQPVILAELVQQKANDCPRHAPKRDDVHDAVVPVLRVLHHAPHAQNSLPLDGGSQILLTLLNDLEHRQLPRKVLDGLIEHLSHTLDGRLHNDFRQLLHHPVLPSTLDVLPVAEFPLKIDVVEPLLDWRHAALGA